MKGLGKVVAFVSVAAVPAGSNLLLTLILVRAFGISGFATWSIIEPLLLIFAAVAALGTNYGVLFTTARGVADASRALGQAMTLVLPFSIAAGCAAWFAVHPHAPVVALPNLALALSAEAMSVLTIASLRGQRRLRTWICFELIRSLSVMVCAFALFRFAPHLMRNVNDLLLLRGSLTAAAVAMVAITMRVRPGLDRALLMRMVRYGLPIALAAMIQLVGNNTDRFLLALLHRPASEIALYAAHQRLAGILTVATTTPLNLWFAVEAIRRDTEQEVEFYRTVLAGVLAATSIMLTGAFIAGPLLWPYFFPGIAFHPQVYALLGLGVVVQAVGIVTNVGGLREKKTHWNTIVVGLSITTMAGLGVPLILLASATGAAIARCSALAVNAATGFTLSQRIAPVRHRFAPLAPFLLALLLSMLALAGPTIGVLSWVLLAASAAATGVGLYLNRSRLVYLRGRPVAAPETASGSGGAGAPGASEAELEGG